MSLSITEYRCKLINKILFAHTEDEVKRFIEAAMRGLKEHKVNGHLIARFVEKASQELGTFIPVSPNDRQCNNIRTAQLRLEQLKQSVL